MKSVRSKEKLAYRFANFVVKYKWLVIGLFIAGLIASCVTMTLNKVSYNLAEYLPEDSISTKAMQIMRDEFDDKGMLYVMVEDVNDEQIAQISKDMAAIPGVSAVIPTSVNKETGDVLYTVMFSDYDATQGVFDSTEELLEYLSDKPSYITGQSAFTYYTRKETEDSILKLGIVIVLIILAMLIFTSRTFFELVPMIIVFGISIAMNMGTNYWFNGISYVSNLVALVLQIALSIDYSVILLHRFMEEKQLGCDAKQAAVNSLAKGVSEILSSSFTTIAGLASLLLMTLPIGVEIGLSLAKSIVFSLITVIFLMPALLVVFQKPLEKTKHKSFVPNVTKPARAIVRARKVIVPLFLVIIVLSGVGQSFNTYAFNMNGGSYIVGAKDAIEPSFGTLNDFVVIVPNGDYKKERALAEDVLEYEIIDSGMSLANFKISDLSSFGGGADGGFDIGNVTLPDFVEITPDTYLTDIAFTRVEYDEIADCIIAELNLGSITGELVKSYVLGIYDGYAEKAGIEDGASVPVVKLVLHALNDEDIMKLVGNIEGAKEYVAMLSQLTALESENYARLRFNIKSDVEGEDTFAFISEVKSTIAEHYGEYYIAGESVVCYEMAELFPRDNMLVSVCIVVFILIILLAMFRNLALPFVLILAIQGGIWINFVIPFLAGNAVSFIGYLIISAIQMGATIDYAIVLTNRYRSIKKDFSDRLDAMAAAQNAVFPTIITSGVILTVTGFALGLATSGVVADMGMLLGIGTLISMLVVLFVLPSLLLVCEGITSKADFSTLFKRKKRAGAADVQTVCDDAECDFSQNGADASSDGSKLSDCENIDDVNTENTLLDNAEGDNLRDGSKND